MKQSSNKTGDSKVQIVEVTYISVNCKKVIIESYFVGTALSDSNGLFVIPFCGFDTPADFITHIEE